MTRLGTDQRPDHSLEEIARLFTPRPDGTAASAHYPGSESHMHAVLSLLQAGHAAISRTPAALYEYDPPPSSLIARTPAVHLPVQRSSGGTNLRDELWSAFRNLAAAHPDKAIESHFERRPMCYFARELSTVVAAGNIDPGPMLELMVTESLRALGVFGESWAPASEGGEAGHFQGYAITWLIIEAPGMKVLVDRQRRLDDLMFGKIGSPKASDPWAYLDAARKSLQ